MKEDSSLAQKDHIRREDILSLPLICSRQGIEKDLLDWFGNAHKDLNLVGTYDLMYNSSLMVREGLGCVLGFDGLIYTGAGSGLCFRRLEPEVAVPLHIIWKKNQVFSQAARLLLEELERMREEERPEEEEQEGK